ncbi:MAG: type II secretion system protein [Clostridia bacterium]|nr:type II secretion system protein [Clostridia bacterium]
MGFKDNAGFTLVEVLAVMAILGLVAALAGSLYLSAQKTWEVVTHREEVQQNLRLAMVRITNDIRKSSGDTVTVDTTAVPNSLDMAVESGVYSRYRVDSEDVLKRNGQPVTTPDMKIVGFYVYEDKIRGQKIFTVVLAGRKGQAGFELQTKVSPRVR